MDPDNEFFGMVSAFTAMLHKSLFLKVNVDGSSQE